MSDLDLLSQGHVDFYLSEHHFFTIKYHYLVLVDPKSKYIAADVARYIFLITNDLDLLIKIVRLRKNL